MATTLAPVRKLLTVEARTTALLVAINEASTRAQAAAEAGDEVAQARQNKFIARAAPRLTALIRSMSELRTRAARALSRAPAVRLRVPARAAFARVLATLGSPTSAQTYLHALGVSPSQLASAFRAPRLAPRVLRPGSILGVETLARDDAAFASTVLSLAAVPADGS
jgi:hypothetical protein